MQTKIISWNVAGLKSLVKLVTRDQTMFPALPASTETTMTTDGTTSHQTTKREPLETFLRLHAADITCLQEVKMTLPDLKIPLQSGGVAHRFTKDEWDIFFAPCTSKEKNEKNFNGVATYVRRSTVPTFKAVAKCLNDPALDELGRCIMTDHGPVVVFNVYAPCAGGASDKIKEKVRRATGARGAMRKPQSCKMVVRNRET